MRCFAHDFRQRHAPKQIVVDKRLRHRQQTARCAPCIATLERQHQVGNQRRPRRVFRSGDILRLPTHTKHVAIGVDRSRDRQVSTQRADLVV